MNTFPIFVRLQQQHCLVIGGGEVAERKIRLLQQAGAVVDVLSLQCSTEVAQMISSHHGNVMLGDYMQARHTLALSHYRLVIAATSNIKINQLIAQDCDQANVWVNVVDDAQNSRFIVPAIIDRAPLTIAVSTAGASPVLARQIRTQLETLIPHATGHLAQIAEQYRDLVKQKVNPAPQRRLFWEDFFKSPLAQQVLNNQKQIISQQDFEDYVQQWQNQCHSTGEVYLVGAGPGDPELLTLKALRLLQQADVVVYDRLVGAPILEMARRDATFIDVGKQKNNHTKPQIEINQLLVDYAKQGLRVCRLKGGDPFIFGRGGEELQTLMQAGISTTVVPGITAAAGCGAYAGIPLTHRDYAQSVRFLTGHLQNDTINLPWSELIFKQQTIVLYMGLSALAQICQQLLAHGMPANTPIALISKGTTPQQDIVLGNLGNINHKLQQHPLQSPTLIIVGDVVRLHPNFLDE